jgi:AraC-like DNA-binding protein
MQFDIFKPHNALETFIRYFWQLKAHRLSPPAPAQQFLAEGMELTFNLADPVEITRPDADGKRVARTFVSGPMTKPMKLRADGRVHIMGVCFRPGGAYAFFPHPANEMANCLSDVQELWGAKGREFEQWFFETCPASRDRVDYLNRYFLHRLSRNGAHDPCVAWAIQAIESRKGLISVNYLAKEAGVSSRHLERKFKERVGMSPKQLCRSLRFKQVLLSKVRNPRGSWTAAALDCGYYDQAHMINDFKHYTGVSPSDFFNNPMLVEPFFTGNF